MGTWSGRYRCIWSGFSSTSLSAWRTADARDLKIALLRHQLRLLLRHAGRSPRLSRWEKLTLAVLAAKLGREVAWEQQVLTALQAALDEQFPG